MTCCTEYVKIAVYRGWLDPYLWGARTYCVCHGDYFCPLEEG